MILKQLPFMLRVRDAYSPHLNNLPHMLCALMEAIGQISFLLTTLYKTALSKIPSADLDFPWTAAEICCLTII